MTAVLRNAPEMIPKLLEAYKRLIEFMLGSECRACGSATGLTFFSHKSHFFQAWHMPMCCILPEFLPAQTENRVTAVYLVRV